MFETFSDLPGIAADWKLYVGTTVVCLLLTQPVGVREKRITKIVATTVAIYILRLFGSIEFSDSQGGERFESLIGWISSGLIILITWLRTLTTLASGIFLSALSEEHYTDNGDISEAYSQMRKGEYQDALANTDLILAREENFEALMVQARIYALMDRRRKARRILKGIVNGPAWGRLERSTAAAVLAEIDKPKTSKLNVHLMPR